MFKYMQLIANFKCLLYPVDIWSGNKRKNFQVMYREQSCFIFNQTGLKKGFLSLNKACVLARIAQKGEPKKRLPYDRRFYCSIWRRLVDVNFTQTAP